MKNLNIDKIYKDYTDKKTSYNTWLEQIDRFHEQQKIKNQGRQIKALRKQLKEVISYYRSKKIGA
ncbi:MAG: hypothetical protein HAW60_05930 [Bdellovibrionales bacterium]|nr:hypothetical protein [Bdellovibrionales bacterium]